MPCYHPLKGFYAESRNPETGKRSVLFSGTRGFYDRRVEVPCGNCIGCRLERSRQWATRCVHEASLYSKNCFITLTFREACPLDGSKVDPTFSLHKHHFQRFMKRLRKRFFGDGKGDVRYFHCGEYGEKLSRPHHHACLFNFDFPDRVLWSVRNGVRLYRSAILEDLWPHGNSTVGDVTFESAAYVARYVVKKLNGSIAEAHYNGRLPEFCTMSRRPGLGADWFKRFSSDVFPKGFVVIRGKISKVPKYYDHAFELSNPDEYCIVKRDRTIAARGNPNYDPDRLEAGEIVSKAMLGGLPRSIE